MKVARRKALSAQGPLPGQGGTGGVVRMLLSEIGLPWGNPLPTTFKENVMLLDTYEQEQQFYNVNFKEATSQAGVVAYRGDLVLVDGEVADAQGRRKPPLVTMKAAVVLAEGDTLKLVAGSLDEMADMDAFLGKYQAAFTTDTQVLLYIVNIAKPMVTEVQGTRIVLIPMTDGLVWNELADEMKLEKSDFKGQSSGDKVITVYDAFKDYKPKYEMVPLAEAMTRTIDAKREARGPV